MRKFRIECRNSFFRPNRYLILLSVKRSWWRRARWEYLVDEKGAAKVFSTFEEAQEEIKKQRREEKTWLEDVYLFSEEGDYLGHHKEKTTDRDWQ